MTVEINNNIISITLQMLSFEQDMLTTEKIYSTVGSVVNMFRSMQRILPEESVDEDYLVREIETLCDVYVPVISTLDDERSHQE